MAKLKKVVAQEMIEIRVMKVVQRMEGQLVELFMTSMGAEELLSHMKVDIFHAGLNPGGYQRDPTESRLREVARYVEKHEGLLPTAILVNLRADDNGAAPGEFIPDDEDQRTGVLRIPKDTLFWVVDGQHRAIGLQRANNALKKADAEATLDYDVPLVFTLGLTKDEEMRLFHLVNSKAKSVETGLAATLLMRAIQKEGKEFIYSGKGKDKDLRKAVGTRVAFHLNETPGSWQGKIRLPNEAKDKKKPLQVNAIASSLEPVLRDHYVRSLYDRAEELAHDWPKVRGVIHTFWTALAELMPNAFADIEHYFVQRTAGVYAFHAIVPDVLYRCRERRDFSVKAMKEILKPLGKWVEDDTWHTDSSEPATKATGMSSIRKLADTMRDELPALETPGLDNTLA